jgi:hypothetical protein
MPENDVSIRYRVNVSISTKGQKTWDCTIETIGCPMEAALTGSDQLVAELEKRYPAQITEGK